MTTDEALAHFKTQTAVARALGIRQASVAGWGEYPPALRQVQLEKLTKGALKAEKDCMSPKPNSQKEGA